MKNKVNSAFMAKKKKQYIMPLIEVTYLKTAELLRPSDESNGGAMPTPPGLAPRRKIEVF